MLRRNFLKSLASTAVAALLPWPVKAASQVYPPFNEALEKLAGLSASPVLNAEHLAQGVAYTVQYGDGGWRVLDTSEVIKAGKRLYIPNRLPRPYNP